MSASCEFIHVSALKWFWNQKFPKDLVGCWSRSSLNEVFDFQKKKSYNDQSRSSPCKFLAICQALEARRIFKARAVMQRWKYSASSVSQAWSSWQHPLSRLWSKSFSQHQEKVTFAAAPARAPKQGGCQESFLNFQKNQLKLLLLWVKHILIQKKYWRRAVRQASQYYKQFNINVTSVNISASLRRVWNNTLEWNTGFHN